MQGAVPREKCMQLLEIGQKAVFTRTISESDVDLFAELTGNFNPIHVDSEYAGRTRYGKKVAHGLLVAS